jgi:hypothetical protein
MLNLVENTSLLPRERPIGFNNGRVRVVSLWDFSRTFLCLRWVA